ncbi:MAG: PEGA domain-containing protein [Chitinivibrionia bacterium]|nr:PEGA domain-containing protein [Chitinivibrionia bacterium]
MFKLKKAVPVILATLVSVWANSGVEIVTHPAGARIYMNGNYLGVSPLTASNVPLGNVVFIAELQGFWEHEVHFVNRSGRAWRLNMSLQELNGNRQQTPVFTAKPSAPEIIQQQAAPQQDQEVVRAEDTPVQQRPQETTEQISLSGINCAVVNEAVAGLDEMTKGRDFQRTQGRITRFTRNAQRVETIMRAQGMSSSAPSTFAIAGLSIELLRTVNDVNKQIMEFNGAEINACTETGFAELVRLDENLDPLTFLPLILRASFATLPRAVVDPWRMNPRAALIMFAWILEDYNLTPEQATAIVSAALAASQGSVYDIRNEISSASGPQKVQITTILTFSTGTLTVGVQQLRTMTKEIQRIRANIRGEI